MKPNQVFIIDIRMLWRQDRDVGQKRQMAKMEYEKTTGALKAVVSRVNLGLYLLLDYLML